MDVIQPDYWTDYGENLLEDGRRKVFSARWFDCLVAKGWSAPHPDDAGFRWVVVGVLVNPIPVFIALFSSVEEQPRQRIVVIVGAGPDHIAKSYNRQALGHIPVTIEAHQKMVIINDDGFDATLPWMRDGADAVFADQC